MSEVHTWSTAAASNTSAVPNGWPDTMVPSGINNSAREMMAAIARWNADLNGSLQTATTSANVYTLTPARTISSYTDGLEFRVRWNVDNTGAAEPTINVSSLGAKTIKDETGGVVPANYLQGGCATHIRYSTTTSTFRIVGPPSTLGRSLATTGYSILPSGVYLQWGKVSVGANTTATATYATTFPTTCASAIVSVVSSSSSYPYNAQLNTNPGTSSCVIRNPNSTTMDCFYLAIGY